MGFASISEISFLTGVLSHLAPAGCLGSVEGVKGRGWKRGIGVCGGDTLRKEESWGHGGVS